MGGGKALSSASPSKLNVLQQPLEYQHARFPGNPAEGKESPTKSFNMQNLKGMQTYSVLHLDKT